MTRLRQSILLSFALALVAACTGPSQAPNQSYNGLRTVASFDSIANTEERSVAIFDEMFKVISHPRCVNCHTADDSPRQGDMMRMHEPPVARNDSGFGVPGMYCNTCHGSENFTYAGGEGSIPGHEIWLMAPATMAWLGKSEAQICAQLKDRNLNGDRTLSEIVEHNSNDGLVGWGWHPGDGRDPAPGSQEVFGELTRAWVDTGAHCPTASAESN